MHTGKQVAEWERMSSLMALTANCNRGKKSKAFEPKDFNPWARHLPRVAKPKPPTVPIAMLKGMFSALGKRG